MAFHESLLYDELKETHILDECLLQYLQHELSDVRKINILREQIGFIERQRQWILNRMTFLDMVRDETIRSQNAEGNNLDEAIQKLMHL